VTMKKLLGWIRDGWLILGVTLVLILLIDATLKSVLSESGRWPTVVDGATSPDRLSAEFFVDSAWAPQHFKELRQARHMRWVSYSYWRRQAFSGETIHIDDRGLRDSWQPEAEAQLEIWVFGGSTVWGTGARDSHTLPSEIGRRLADLGRPARMRNFGESGYVSTQGLIRLQRELQSGARPDAVLFYDGVNDVFAALQSGSAGMPQNESERIADFRATNGLDNWLAAFPRTLEGVQRLVGVSEPPAIDALAADVAAAWEANIKTIQAMGESHGFDSYFFWQPSIFQKPELSDVEQRILDASLAAHRDLQLAADAAASAVAARHPMVFDLSQVFSESPSPVYMDFCHLSETGNGRVAAAILARIGNQLQ
jgi:lysophospholipase L1-like esterase